MAGLGDREFALGAYVATHDPIDGADAVVLGAASTAHPDPLVDARGDPDDLI
ncbi:DUF7858 family protein [Halonotius pteroides]